MVGPAQDASRLGGPNEADRSKKRRQRRAGNTIRTRKTTVMDKKKKEWLGGRVWALQTQIVTIKPAEAEAERDAADSAKVGVRRKEGTEGCGGGEALHCAKYSYLRCS